jgi:hypothetical protein
MVWREIRFLVLIPAGLALAAALALASPAGSGENSQPVWPAVLVGDDLLRIFQEGKDAAEQIDPRELSLGTAFDPQPAQPTQTPAPPAPTDYR